LIALAKVPLKDLRKRLLELEFGVNNLLASDLWVGDSSPSLVWIITFRCFSSTRFGHWKSRPGYLGSVLSQSSLFLWLSGNFWQSITALFTFYTSATLYFGNFLLTVLSYAYSDVLSIKIPMICSFATKLVSAFIDVR
jgi:hypothetical protein